MEVKLKTLSINGEKVSLKINYGKRKLKRICFDIDMRYVKYLVYSISSDSGSDADILVCINIMREHKIRILFASVCYYIYELHRALQSWSLQILVSGKFWEFSSQTKLQMKNFEIWQNPKMSLW